MVTKLLVKKWKSSCGNHVTRNSLKNFWFPILPDLADPSVRMSLLVDYFFIFLHTNEFNMCCGIVSTPRTHCSSYNFLLCYNKYEIRGEPCVVAYFEVTKQPLPIFSPVFYALSLFSFNVFIKHLRLPMLRRHPSDSGIPTVHVRGFEFSSAMHVAPWHALPPVFPDAQGASFPAPSSSTQQ